MNLWVPSGNPLPGASASRVGLPGATPGPVVMEDRWVMMNHSSVVSPMRDDTYAAARTQSWILPGFLCMEEL